MKYLIALTLLCLHGCLFAQPKKTQEIINPQDVADLVCFWDFQGSTGSYLTSKGTYQYTLEEMNGPIVREKEGIFGSYSLQIARGQWLRIKREDCPALNIHGKEKVTVVAWIKRRAENHWQYIAGMWDEGEIRFKGKSRGVGPGAPARQYALFINGHKQADYVSLTRVDADNQVHGYVSDTGGATPGKPFSFSYATGQTFIKKDTWYMVAFTYDQQALRVYVNGALDSNSNHNPFYWNKPIYDGEENGADFTVAQRAVPSWPDYPVGVPGNKVGFGGLMGGLAVYQRALEPSEIQHLYRSSMRNVKTNAQK